MGGIRALLAFIMLIVPALAAAQPFAPAAPGQRIVYRGATIIDGTGGAPQTGMAVITNGERIEEVLPVARLTPELLQGATIVDLTGRFLLPGLIDSHQHRATPPNRALAEAQMRRDLYGGITAARIMADDLRSIAELDRAARAGEIAGPDFRYAALVAGRGFFDDPRTAQVSAGYTPGDAPWAQAIDAETDIPLAIARARGTGASALKIYADLPADLIRRLSEEAHRQGMQVWVHGMVFPTPPADVLAAGPNVVSHTCYLAYQAMDRRPQSYRERAPIDAALFAHGDNPVIARLFATMRAEGMLLDPTLRVYQVVEQRATAARPPYCTLDLAARLTNQAYRAGLLLSAGTDSDTPRDAPYPGLFEEMELLVRRAGLTPLDAIRAATQIGAMTMEEGQNMGVIATGFLANLVVLERDPVTDISNMRSVLFTVKRGRRFDRADFRPGEIPADD